MVRLFLGLTQQDFARQFGLTASTVAKIEVGLTRVSDATKAKVLRKFDVSKPEFIDFTDLMERSQV